MYLQWSSFTWYIHLRHTWICRTRPVRRSGNRVKQTSKNAMQLATERDMRWTKWESWLKAAVDKRLCLTSDVWLAVSNEHVQYTKHRLCLSTLWNVCLSVVVVVVVVVAAAATVVVVVAVVVWLVGFVYFVFCLFACLFACLFVFVFVFVGFFFFFFFFERGLLHIKK